MVWDKSFAVADSPGKAALKDHLMKERVIAKPNRRAIKPQPATTVVKEESKSRAIRDIKN